MTSGQTGSGDGGACKLLQLYSQQQFCERQAAGLMPLTAGKQMTGGQTEGVMALHASSLNIQQQFCGHAAHWAARLMRPVHVPDLNGLW